MNEQERTKVGPLGREILERVLYPLIINAEAKRSWWRRILAKGLAGFFAVCLAKVAIIVPVEVEHTEETLNVLSLNVTDIRMTDDMGSRVSLALHGHRGTPGEGWAIILPRKEEKRGREPTWDEENPAVYDNTDILPDLSSIKLPLEGGEVSFFEQLTTFFKDTGVECDDVSDDYQFITLKRPDGMKLYLMAELDVRKHSIGTSIGIHLWVPEEEEK